MAAFNSQRRLLFAAGFSALFHSLLLVTASVLLGVSAPPDIPISALLQAHLMPQSERTPLLKNTLSDGKTTVSDEFAVPSPTPGRKPKAREQDAQRKLFEHLFYPPEAVARGLEGEVRLLLILDPQGRILEARLASSSGHALLDQAATDAAHAMRSIPAAGVSELILPVVFKLQ